MKIFTFPLIFAWIAVCALQVFGQTFYGSIVGTVTDPSDASIPNVAVTLTNPETSERRRVLTDSIGNYQLLNLVPGNYQINAEAPGFNHFRRSEIQVQVASTVRIDISMMVGDMTQTVEVTAQTPLLQTDNASISHAITGRQVADMPLNGRNIMNLVALVPGVVPGGTLSGSPQLNQGGTVTNPPGFASYYAGGGLPNTGSTYIDGASMALGQLHSTSIVLTQDAVQEFRVQITNVEPEYGAVANGAVNFTTKSGTNDFHGGLYEFLRNKALNANTFFSNRAGLVKPVFTQNQFGANVGGPLLKNKLFFFSSYEGYRVIKESTTTLTLPTLEQRRGDFSNYRNAQGNLIPIYDPDTTCGVLNNPACGANQTQLRTPFPGNIIPADRIDNTAKLMLRYFGIPNRAGDPFTGANNFVKNVSRRAKHDQLNIRLDHNLSDAQRMFGRFTYWNLPSEPVDVQDVGTSPDGRSYRDTKQYVRMSNVVLGHTYIVNPSSVIDVRLSYNRMAWVSDNWLNGMDLTTVGWPASYNSEFFRPIIPSLAPQGFAASGAGGGPLNHDISNSYGISGSLTKIWGRHKIKVGAQFQKMPNNWGEPAAIGGATASFNQFRFTNLFTSANPLNPAGTGSGMASYLLGLGSEGLLGNYILGAQQEQPAGIYVGDTIQASDRLTLNVGLRWDYPGYWTERWDRATVFMRDEVNPVLRNAGLQYKGDVVLVNSDRFPYRSNQAPHWKLFAPRLGLAYRATDTLVVRSGFGTTYLPNDVLRDNLPFTSPINMAPTFWITTLDGSRTAASKLSNPFPTGIIQPPGRDPSYAQRLLGNRMVMPSAYDDAPYMAQWSFEVEQQVGEAAMFGAGYIGSRGIHLPSGSRVAGTGTSLNQIASEHLSLGSKLLEQVPNPFLGLGIRTGLLSGATVPYGQLLVPYPQYAGVYSPTQAAYDTNYHSLITKFQRRFNRGGNILASYTWSKNVGTADNMASFLEGSPLGGIQDFNNLRTSRALLSFDVAHRAVVSYVLDLPIGKGRSILSGVQGIADKIVSGWAIEGIASFQSGYPIPLTAQQNAIPLFFYGGDTRPNVTAGCDKTIAGSAQSRLGRWFNTSCFAQPSQFAFGTEGRTDPDLRSHGINNFDTSLVKSAALTERVGLKFRFEVFNLFNRVQFAVPGNQLGTPQFGQVSAQQNQPRLIQLALRLSF